MSASGVAFHDHKANGPSRRADMPAVAEVYVYPGQLVASKRAAVVTTILGTCVAVCLFDAKAKVGGLNHYLLPQVPRNGDQSSRFGDVATHRPIDDLCRYGATTSLLRAKVFGGITSTYAIGHNLGAQNVAVAMGVLSERGIEVVATDVGGTRSRKVIFHTDTGNAWVRYF